MVKGSRNYNLVTQSAEYYSYLGAIDIFYNYYNSRKAEIIFGKMRDVKTPLNKRT